MSPRTRQNDLFPPRVLSGVQPSGALHLGNFFGAIKQHIALQHEYPGESFYFIANYHALTTIHDADGLLKQSWSVALDYLALGLEPNKATFYRQSDVPQVCELMWILACVTGKGILDRGHAYKDKIEKGLTPSVGLFLYPELMAADILAVRSTIVPVGKDQEQHLEMARDIANSFNHVFQTDVFPTPVAKLNEAAIVPGIDGQKMSKSYENTISIFAEDDELEAKVMHIKTSSTALGAPLNPSGDTVFTLYSLVSTSDQRDEMRERYQSGDIGYQQAKIELLANLKTYFSPFKERRRALEEDLDQVEDILRDGARRARQEAVETVEMVREVIGLDRYQRGYK
ncbi:MAG: Tryptophan--tRNA ligase [Gammaproteobacteria bacterium]|nr:Tryptophan--tRNA ligase [Gammaproteobacteria bacterium]